MRDLGGEFLIPIGKTTNELDRMDKLLRDLGYVRPRSSFHGAVRDRTGSRRYQRVPGPHTRTAAPSRSRNRAGGLEIGAILVSRRTPLLSRQERRKAGTFARHGQRSRRARTSVSP